MKAKTIWCNYVDDNIKQEASTYLKKGYAVRIGADCIGHTRSQMIQESARKFFEEIGAKEIEMTFNEDRPDLITYTETMWCL